MKITNKHNLPEDVVRMMYPALLDAEIEAPNLNKFRASKMADPPMKYCLTVKHWEEISIDVSDDLFALLGRMGHKVFEGEPNQPYVFKEHNMSFNGSDYTLSGTLDKWDNGHLKDVKFTSVWSANKGVKPEWEIQVNIYNWLWTTTMPKSEMTRTQKASIYCFLRDWTKNKANQSSYPSIPFVAMPVTLWDMELVEDFINTRISEFRSGTPRPCTASEKWQDPAKTALMKKGRKTAIKLFDTKEEAEKHLEHGLYLEDRPSIPKRCIDYCSVNRFCKDYVPERPIGAGDEELIG